MDAIKKKMQAMKIEKDNAMDRADQCEQAAKVAKVKTNNEIQTQKKDKKDNVMDRADQCEQAAKFAKVEREQTNREKTYNV